MIQRLKYWIFKKGESCRYCCLWCRYYGLCKDETTHERRIIKVELPDGQKIELHTMPAQEKKAKHEAVKARGKERDRRQHEKL